MSTYSLCQILQARLHTNNYKEMQLPTIFNSIRISFGYSNTATLFGFTLYFGYRPYNYALLASSSVSVNEECLLFSRSLSNFQLLVNGLEFCGPCPSICSICVSVAQVAKLVGSEKPNKPVYRINKEMKMKSEFWSWMGKVEKLSNSINLKPPLQVTRHWSENKAGRAENTKTRDLSGW